MKNTLATVSILTLLNTSLHAADHEYKVRAAVITPCRAYSLKPNPYEVMALSPDKLEVDDEYTIQCYWRAVNIAYGQLLEEYVAAKTEPTNQQQSILAKNIATLLDHDLELRKKYPFLKKENPLTPRKKKKR